MESALQAIQEQFAALCGCLQGHGVARGNEHAHQAAAGPKADRAVDGPVLAAVPNGRRSTSPLRALDSGDESGSDCGRSRSRTRREKEEAKRIAAAAGCKKLEQMGFKPKEH
eukprot:10866934-Karenia_brevis.AAC.1